MTTSTAAAPKLSQPRLADPPGAAQVGAAEARILLPFTGPLDPHALDTAIGIAQEEAAALVAAYLTIVPLRYREDSPLHDVSWAASPLLGAVEGRALDAGVPVVTRIGRGRSLTHALARLWAAERFTRIVATASDSEARGLSETDLAWLIAHAPAPTLVLKPGR